MRLSPRASGETALTGPAKSGAITLPWTTGPTASLTGAARATLTKAARATLTRTARATLTGVTGTGSAGCGLVALLFTEKFLNLFAAGPFVFADIAVAIFIKLFEEQFPNVRLAAWASLGLCIDGCEQ